MLTWAQGPLRVTLPLAQPLELLLPLPLPLDLYHALPPLPSLLLLPPLALLPLPLAAAAPRSPLYLCPDLTPSQVLAWTHMSQQKAQLQARVLALLAQVQGSRALQVLHPVCVLQGLQAWDQVKAWALQRGLQGWRRMSPVQGQTIPSSAQPRNQRSCVEAHASSAQPGRQGVQPLQLLGVRPVIHRQPLHCPL